MSEYISREEMIDRLRKIELSADQIRLLVYPKEAVVGAIYDCTSADVRPNIHGEWIKIQSGDKDFPESIVCSKCKNENSHLDFNEHGEPIGKVFVTSKFCPNCGADMRGPKDIIHKAIDNTTFAEEAYPNIKEELHKAVDMAEPIGEKGTE